MASTGLLKKQDYVALRRDIKAIIETGKERAQDAAAQELVVAYWNVGERIAEEQLNQKAKYYDAIVKDLAQDLDIKERTLHRTVVFYQSYAKAPRVQGLGWSHYRLLLQLRDEKERTFYTELASKEGLSARQLTSVMRSERYQKDKKRKRRVQLKRPKETTFCYRAEVQDVVDADTLILDVDLGFEVLKRQRLRLASIDAPERRTAAGKKGRRFVREQLAVAETVVVKTVKQDVHGRYVAHVFFSAEKAGLKATFLEGRYLNQILIDKGFAREM